jgi:hypothetical protein
MMVVEQNFTGAEIPSVEARCRWFVTGGVEGWVENQ